MRTGSELLQATKPFIGEDLKRSWTGFIAISLIVIATLAIIAIAPLWPVKLAAGVLLGFLQIRLFIYYHDYLHGAILRRSKVAEKLMAIVGGYMLSVRSVWRETHNYHHKNNSKLIGSSIGSFPLLTTGMWRGMSARDRRMYKLVRHPLFIFGGYFTTFLLGMSFAPFRRDAKKHWGGPAAVVMHFAILGVTWWLLGAATALCMWLVPSIVSMGLGSYMFYAQHNFPGIQLRGRREWDYTHAALKCASFFEMSPVMHWLTGNIGYHHVHHLNHRIPFYRLPEAMAALPELQTPGRTSWSPKDIMACLRCKLWDPERQEMVGYQDAEQTVPATVAEAA